MTAIKHTLHRDVFLPSDERLVGFVHVTKVGRKKKSSFLCAVLSSEAPVVPKIYQVKKADKGESYKKKTMWLLRDLKVVDGKSSSKETAEFELTFEKVFKWVASSVTDKESFISWLWKLSQRYLNIKPDFLNVPKQLMQEYKPTETGPSAQQDDITVMEEDYQALSSKEESDLTLMMSECRVAISNAEVFAEQLSKQLSVLDGANIHSIMGSEDQVLNLMRLLDDGIQQAEIIESKLESYDDILQIVKDQIEMLRDKDMLMNVRNQNHQKLQEELEKLVMNLDLDAAHIKALNDGDLSTPNGILDCTLAAQALQSGLQADIHHALKRMAAVEEQQKKMLRLSSSFSKRLAHHLNNLFIHQGNEMEETLSRQIVEYKLPPHHSCHRDLTPYSELMLWLKNADIKTFKDLSQVYTQSLSRLYTKETQEFIEMAKQKLMTKPDKSKLGISSQSAVKLSGSSTSLTKTMDMRKRSGSMQSVDSASLSMHGSDTDLAMRHMFDQLLDKVFSELEPFCIAEQDFCVRFFHLVAHEQPEEKLEEEGAEGGDIWMPQQQAPKIERHINEEVRGMMKDLFPSLEEDLDGFFSHADRLDGFNSLYMLVRMSQHVSKPQNTGTFLSKMFANCLVKIKRNFDKFIQNQVRAIQETKVPKKSKCGIIPFVYSFEDFATQAESIFRGSERHVHLDRAYVTLVAVIFEQIANIAQEHLKTPKDVIMFENFHHMFSILSTLKVKDLENSRKKAKQTFQDHIFTYTTEVLGRALEKLQIFCDGVQAKINSGVKPEEVGYHSAFSKQELRKVIKEYPGKEVKKTLEHLYKKIEKTLCEEENLLQVVWLAMQDVFIKQCKKHEDRINKCYPDSGISLEFTVNDVLQYFQDIAQSH